MTGNYAYSLVSYSGMSWVENVKGHVPLSDSIFFTPGNSISLKYSSSYRGFWETTIFYPERRTYILKPQEEVLSFRVYMMEGVDWQGLPTVALLQGDTCTARVDLGEFLLPSMGDNKWLHVAIPIRDFPEFQKNLPVVGITFCQGNPTATGTTNHILVDQIEFTLAAPEATELSYAAVLDRVEAFERHVLLEWQLPLDPAIRYAQIYRSEDNENYRAVAVRPIMNASYADVVPVTNKSYFYKVTWLDQQYHESPPSQVQQAKTAPISDDALVMAIQAAHINYFIQRTEFNSGMHAVQMLDENALVSVEETGYSLLAVTVGASHEQISNRAYVRRLNNVVDFLCDQAEEHKGMFPAFLNGRNGNAVYAHEKEGVSVRATSSLMQGLLVARNYLKNLIATRQDGRQDRASRQRIENTISRIDQLWLRIQWNEFALDENRILFDNWSPQHGFNYARPMGGFGADLLSYLLAVSSPDYAVSSEAYEKGLGYQRVDNDEFVNDEFQLMGDEEMVDTDSLDLMDWLEIPFLKDTLLYGFHINVGSLDHNLMEAFMPFMTFDPRNKEDRYTNYEESLSYLIQAYKRRDNEIDAGNLTSDIWGTVKMEDGLSRLPVIVPAISLGSYAFTPQVAQSALRALYHTYAPILFTEYGFRNWMSIPDHQVSEGFNGLNQAAIPVMIENGRTGLIWNLFMQHEDIDRTVSAYFKEDL